MLKMLPKPILLLTILTLCGLCSFTQNVTINYGTWTPPDPSLCDIFRTPTDVQGYIHATTKGQPTYDGNRKSVVLTGFTNYGHDWGAEYEIRYNFKKGYSYKITVNVIKIPQASGDGAILRLMLKSGVTDHSGCNGPDLVDYYEQVPVDTKRDQIISATSFTDAGSVKTFEFPTQSQSQSSLVVEMIPSTSSAVINTYINKITIEETLTQEFTLTPSSLSINCGTSTPQTFAVTPNDIQGITSYEWNLGSTNGWLYNGTAAPQTISTTTNTIDLTPSPTATSLSNVYVTIKVNGVSYQTKSSNVSFIVPTYSIIGDDLFCTTSNTYSIQNLPAGVSVQWQATPQGVVTINSPNSPQTTLTKLTNGTVNLTANISGFCFGQATKTNIGVGSPTPGPISFPLIDPAMGKIQASIDPVPGATSYNWYVDGQLVSDLYGYGTFIQFPISRQCDINYDVAVEAVGTCGTSSQSHNYAYVPCDGFYMMSPNPATSDVTVSVDQTATQTTETTISELKIYDQQGNLKKLKKYNKVRSATINVSDLRNGNYWIEIKGNNQAVRKQLLIQR